MYILQADFFDFRQGSKNLEDAKTLESILERDCYRTIQTVRRNGFLNQHVKRVLSKYDTMPYDSHTPINAALAHRLIRTVRILISRYYTLKNNAPFIHGLDKIMMIYNQHLIDLRNLSPLEFHHGENTLDIFLNNI